MQKLYATFKHFNRIVELQIIDLKKKLFAMLQPMLCLGEFVSIFVCRKAKFNQITKLKQDQNM